jgi:hypothetical protein
LETHDRISLAFRFRPQLPCRPSKQSLFGVVRTGKQGLLVSEFFLSCHCFISSGSVVEDADTNRVTDSDSVQDRCTPYSFGVEIFVRYQKRTGTTNPQKDFGGWIKIQRSRSFSTNELKRIKLSFVIFINSFLRLIAFRIHPGKMPS